MADVLVEVVDSFKNLQWKALWKDGHGMPS
jgi:hypothetical protein